jgi:hypothetical protein
VRGRKEREERKTFYIRSEKVGGGNIIPAMLLEKGS